ncbi:unnamed protein product [Closterium sp. NIES-65]|nr:unnamed protein product [Closterium sp. NIES-65]
MIPRGRSRDGEEGSAMNLPQELVVGEAPAQEEGEVSAGTGAGPRAAVPCGGPGAPSAADPVVHQQAEDQLQEADQEPEEETVEPASEEAVEPTRAMPGVTEWTTRPAAPAEQHGDCGGRDETDAACAEMPASAEDEGQTERVREEDGTVVPETRVASPVPRGKTARLRARPAPLRLGSSLMPAGGGDGA